MQICEREEETCIICALFERCICDFLGRMKERENNIQNIDSLNASESLVKNLSWPLLERKKVVQQGGYLAV